MKTLSLKSLAIFFFAITMIVACGKKADENNAQTNNNNTEQNDDKDKDAGKKDFKKIDKTVKKLDKKSSKFEVKESKLEGGPEVVESKCFIDGDKVRKIVYTTGGDHGRRDESYYFDEEENLIFASIVDAGIKLADDGQSSMDTRMSFNAYYMTGDCLKVEKAEAMDTADNIEKAFKGAAPEELDSAKGMELISRASALKEMLRGGVGNDWEGIEALSL